MVKRSCEGTWKLSTCQPRSQCFSLLLYLLFFRDWNAVFQYHTIQWLLIFCSTYHRQPSVCFTEASRFTENGTPSPNMFSSMAKRSSIGMPIVFGFGTHNSQMAPSRGLVSLNPLVSSQGAEESYLTVFRGKFTVQLQRESILLIFNHHRTWSKQTIVLRLKSYPCQFSSPFGRTFPYEARARSAESTKRDKGCNLPPRD